MQFEFTPASHRALLVAAGWTSYDDSPELDLAEVLVGLVAEPECRAALILAEVGIDRDTIRAQFPGLRQLSTTETGREQRFSADWRECLFAACALLSDYPRPLELATEHLLLGLTATDSDVSRWLAERGLDAERLEARVHQLSGHRPGPLDLDPAAEAELPLTDQPARMEAEASAEVQQQDRLAMFRILDAAANRAGEGLRVIEDFLRFALDDRHLTVLAKSIRHDLTDALAVFPTTERHLARDTRGDVGTDLALLPELARGNARAVLAANFKRVEQSLRSLEEYSKIESPLAAAAIERLRYQVYTLERAVDLTQTNLARLATARLYVLIDGGSSSEQFAERAQAFVAAGVSILQLRDKKLADRELLTRARLLREATRDTQTLFIMNDRPDLAALSEADGVHVGQDELSVRDARRIVGTDRLVGVSTHSLEQARAAVLDGADYIGVGPTFPSGTKQFANFTGPELLRAVSAEIRLPAFAIGGISESNLDEVLAAGFTRVAVSGAITSAANPVEEVQKLIARLTAK